MRLVPIYKKASKIFRTDNSRFSIGYFGIVLGIAMLFVIGKAGKNYYMVKNPELVRFESDTGIEYLTPSISLPAGTYQFIVNYRTSTDAVIETHVGRTIIESDKLECNSECGYYVLDAIVEVSSSDFYFRVLNAKDLEIFNYEISCNKLLYNDNYYYAILIFVIAVFLYIQIMKYRIGKIAYDDLFVRLILMGIAIFVSAPTLNEYLIYGFDIDFHLARIEGIKDAFLDGQIIPYIYPNNNNEYGVLGFMYPFLFLVPSALLRMCNISMVAAYHFYVILVNITTVMAAWKASQSFTASKKLSLLCVLLCACNPVRLTGLYQSAAVGAAFATAVMPLVFAGLYEIVMGNKRKWYYLTLAYSTILMSHVLSCVIVASISVVILIVYRNELMDKKEKRYVYFTKSVATFFVLNLWYIVPFVRFYTYSLNGDFIYSNHYYKDTIIPTKLFMMSAANACAPQTEFGILDGCNQSLGIAGLLCIFLIVAYCLHRDENSKISKKWYILCTTIVVISIFLATSAFPWFRMTEFEWINKIMGVIQFPHRFYAELMPVLFVLAPAVLDENMNHESSIQNSLKYMSDTLVVILIIFSIIGGYSVMDIYNVQEPYKFQISGGYNARPLVEYFPEGAQMEALKGTEPHNFGSKTISYAQNGTRAYIECRTYDEGAYIDLPMLYYPNYYAIDDNGKFYNVSRNVDGKIHIDLPIRAGVQRITVFYNRLIN